MWGTTTQGRYRTRRAQRRGSPARTPARRTPALPEGPAGTDRQCNGAAIPSKTDRPNRRRPRRGPADFRTLQVQVLRTAQEAQHDHPAITRGLARERMDTNPVPVSDRSHAPAWERSPGRSSAPFLEGRFANRPSGWLCIHIGTDASLSHPTRGSSIHPGSDEQDRHDPVIPDRSTKCAVHRARPAREKTEHLL